MKNTVILGTAGLLLAATSNLHAQGIPAGPDYPRALTLAPAGSGDAGGGGDSVEKTEALAKAVQNPVANMISVPFQNNFNFGVGPNDVTQYILNVQPVIPISLNEDWNLITRTILPIINQPSPAPGIPPAFGLGDVNPTVFLSPAKSAKLIWGAGPTMTLPTATDSLLGNGMWAAGPAVVALTMRGHWVIGALANQQWSFAGWGNRDVSALLIQPFINYNLPGGWYLTSAPHPDGQLGGAGQGGVDHPGGRRRREDRAPREAAAELPAQRRLECAQADGRSGLAAPRADPVPVPEMTRPSPLTPIRRRHSQTRTPKP